MAKQHVFQELAESKGIWVFVQGDAATDYRDNGHRATLGDSHRCNRYKTPKRIYATLKAQGVSPSRHLPAIAQFGTEHVLRYYFDHVNTHAWGAIPNFLPGHSPYENQAHHLIPELRFLALFPDRERNMLKRIDYNVHNGRNIMFLPALSTDCGFHNLPYHQSKHPKYSAQVETDAKKLADELKELSEDACDEEAVRDIRDELLDLQDDYWDILANAGAISVNDIVLKRGKNT